MTRARKKELGRRHQPDVWSWLGGGLGAAVTVKRIRVFH